MLDLYSECWVLSVSRARYISTEFSSPLSTLKNHSLVASKSAVTVECAERKPELKRREGRERIQYKSF